MWLGGHAAVSLHRSNGLTCDTLFLGQFSQHRHWRESSHTGTLRGNRLTNALWYFFCGLVGLEANDWHLTQISAYSSHKNLAVRKIMEEMRTAYAENGTWFPYVSNKTWLVANDHGTYASIVTEESAHRLRTFYFAESFDEPGGTGAFEMRHSFLYFLTLVRICEFLYANFSLTWVRCKLAWPSSTALHTGSCTSITTMLQVWILLHYCL